MVFGLHGEAGLNVVFPVVLDTPSETGLVLNQHQSMGATPVGVQVQKFKNVTEVHAWVWIFFSALDRYVWFKNKTKEDKPSSFIKWLQSFPDFLFIQILFKILLILFYIS